MKKIISLSVVCVGIVAVLVVGIVIGAVFLAKDQEKREEGKNKVVSSEVSVEPSEKKEKKKYSAEKEIRKSRKPLRSYANCKSINKDPKWARHFLNLIAACVVVKRDITVYEAPFFLMIKDERLWKPPKNARKNGMAEEYKFALKRIEELKKDVESFTIKKGSKVMMLYLNKYMFLEHSHGFIYYHMFARDPRGRTRAVWFYSYYISEYEDSIYITSEEERELVKKYGSKKKYYTNTAQSFSTNESLYPDLLRQNAYFEFVKE